MISLMRFSLSSHLEHRLHMKRCLRIYSPSQAVVQRSLLFIHCPFPLLLQEIGGHSQFDTFEHSSNSAHKSSSMRKKRDEREWIQLRMCIVFTSHIFLYSYTIYYLSSENLDIYTY